MTDQIVSQVGESATPERVVVREACVWRGKDKRAIANKDDPQAQREEYHARKNLRQAVDVLEQKRSGSGQP